MSSEETPSAVRKRKEYDAGLFKINKHTKTTFANGKKLSNMPKVKWKSRVTGSMKMCVSLLPAWVDIHLLEGPEQSSTDWVSETIEILFHVALEPGSPRPLLRSLSLAYSSHRLCPHMVSSPCLSVS